MSVGQGWSETSVWMSRKAKMLISPLADVLNRHDSALSIRTQACLIDDFIVSVEDLLELNYILDLLNRQNLKHELFALPRLCGTLLLQHIVYQWFGSCPIYPYC